MKPTVLLTMGDGRGIGPEVIVRALSLPSVRRLANLLVIGDLQRMRGIARVLKISTPINVLDLGPKGGDRAPLRYIDMAVSLINKKEARALVTAPVNKESITRSGVKFSGHTEYLAKLTKTKKFAMMFVGKRLKVTVVTRHIPLKKVAKAITTQRIVDAALLTHRYLKDSLKIRRPRIGVCALNPHAGEGGTIGREEEKVILPAIKMLKKRIPHLSGPIPADSAFNLHYSGGLEALIAMYHDQGMIPVKMVGREACVNVTLGLPFIRTSPVHGTAYDIAGKGLADPSGMIEAIRMACRC